jgi:hypothetical protein
MLREKLNLYVALSRLIDPRKWDDPSAHGLEKRLCPVQLRMKARFTNAFLDAYVSQIEHNAAGLAESIGERGGVSGTLTALLLRCVSVFRDYLYAPFW